VSATSYSTAGYAVAAAVEMQHLKHAADHFSFAPFRKSFEEVINLITTCYMHTATFLYTYCMNL
jgi:hypothetical protein